MYIDCLLPQVRNFITRWRMDRRQFVQVMSAAALAASRSVTARENSRRPLRILVLGGTKFIGVHIVELALQHGHSVTLFNRGKTNADLFPQLVHLKGDRDAQLNRSRANIGMS